jgi:hypothetical protein
VPQHALPACEAYWSYSPKFPITHVRGFYFTASPTPLFAQRLICAIWKRSANAYVPSPGIHGCLVVCGIKTLVTIMSLYTAYWTRPEHLYGAAIGLSLIDVAVVAARFWARRRQQQAIKWDDWFIIPAAVRENCRQDLQNTDMEARLAPSSLVS